MYHFYLQETGGVLVKRTRELRREISRGRLSAAMSLYSIFRVPYGQLLPIASQFERSNSRVEEARLSIEHSLFGRRTTRGLREKAARLATDVERLRARVKYFEPTVSNVVEAAQDAVAEILERKMQGKEEPYSKIDMVDVSASIEGVEHAFAAIRPSLVAADPEAAREIEADFAIAYIELTEFIGSPFWESPQKGFARGTQFPAFDQVSSANLQKVARPLEDLRTALAELPSQIPKS